MADRRRNNTRKRRRRGRFGFLYKALSAIVILAAIVAGCVIFFRVNSVIVDGESRYTPKQIEEVSGVEVGDNLLFLNKNQIVRNIRTQLPYIATVAIRQSLPDTVVLVVTEVTPAAVIQGEESWWILDSKGKLLEETASVDQTGYAKITGIEALLPSVGSDLAVDNSQSDKYQSLKELLAALDQLGLVDKVSSIDLTEYSRITMGYDGRFTVVLPMVSENIVATLEGLEQAIGKLGENEMGTLDITRDLGKGKWWYFTPS